MVHSAISKVIFLFGWLTAQTVAQDALEMVRVKAEDLVDEHRGNIRHRELFNQDGEIVVNGAEVGPFTLAEYVSSNTAGTTQIFKTTQTIPAATQVTCQLRVNAALAPAVSLQVIVLKATLPSGTVGLGDAFDTCAKPSAYSTSCQVQYTSVTAEPFYVMVYGQIGNIFDAYIRCTAPNVPAPTTTSAPNSAPTPTSPTIAPAPSPSVAIGTETEAFGLGAGQSIEFVYPNIPANTEVTCALSCDETTGNNRFLYANFGGSASSGDFDALDKGGCPLATKTTSPGDCSSDLYIRAEVTNTDSAVTSGRILCTCDSCTNVCCSAVRYVRNTVSRVAAYWTG